LGGRRVAAGLARLAVVVLATGCTTRAGSAAAPHAAGPRPGTAAAAAPASTFTAPPAGTAGRLTPLIVYYPRMAQGRWYLVPERHQVPLATRPVEAALNELLVGQPRYAGSARPFPAGSRLLGLEVEGGTATVDLSREVVRVRPGEPTRYAVQAVVWTVSRAEDVRRVQVRVEGRTAGEVDGRALDALWGGRGSPDGLVRDPEIRLAPVGLVEPSPRARVRADRIVIKGEASVPGGVVSLRLWDAAGKVAAQGFTTTGASRPSRVPFTAALGFDPPASPATWTLEVFEADPGDGSVRYSVQVPVDVGL
jgi:germination protein M